MRSPTARSEPLAAARRITGEGVGSLVLAAAWRQSAGCTGRYLRVGPLEHSLLYKALGCHGSVAGALVRRHVDPTIASCRAWYSDLDASCSRHSIWLVRADAAFTFSLQTVLEPW